MLQWNRWWALLGVAIISAVTARAEIHIVIDQPEDQRFPIAISNLVAADSYEGSSDILKKIPEVIRNDLTLSGYFFVIGTAAYKDRSAAMSSSDIPFDQWTAVGAQGVVKGVAMTEGGRTSIQLRLFDVSTRQMQMGKQYTFDRNDWRVIAHRFSDEIMKATTGMRGPFATKLAYTQQTSNSKKSRWKQIFVMDVDGANVVRLTKDNSYNLAPNWAPDGKQLVYTSYVMGTPEIFTTDILSGQRRQLTQNDSTNITPTYSPNGSMIAWSSGQGADMDIYLMNNIGSDSRPFSPTFGADLAPAFSPDGQTIVFASERGGKLHLYKQSLGGGAATRLTFSGSLNDSPDWSPDGTKIAYTSYAGGVYQIHTISPDGSNHRVVTSVGSNEHPRFSPDSRYITYSSTLAGKTRVYLMRYDGANKTPLTRGKDASLPDWGPWPDDYFSESE